MSRDIDALESLASAAATRETAPSDFFTTLQTIYEKIGPGLPKDLVATPVHTPMEEDVFHYNYDEAHGGRFSVPRSSGGSVSLQEIMRRPHPLPYISSDLTFFPPSQRNGRLTELVAFIPGLNTLHQPAPGETSTVERVIHYGKVLNIPITQIHLGTSMDQNNIVLSPDEAAPILPLLKPIVETLPGGFRPKIHRDTITWNARQIDQLQSLLSYPNLIETPIKKSIQTLLDSTKDPNGQPFTLIGYSRGAVEVEAALRKHCWDNKSDPKTEQLLRRCVTVLTVGNGSRAWPDGPAYVHLSSNSDNLTLGQGVYAERPKGAGADAVFLHCDSPYHPEASDNHNFGAITSQYLSIVMATNGVTSVRDLWEKAQRDEMKLPQQEDKVVRAMIQLTRGYEWLWDTRAAWRDIPHGALPNEEKAKETVRDVMGETFLNDILANFGRK